MTGSEGASPRAFTPPPANPRFPLFDGLRGIAALSILVFHAGFYSRAIEGEAGLSPYLARLNVGVAVFFVISGFLLYRPLVAARIGDGPPLRLRDYARRRGLRIVPAYWVALTLLAIYPGLQGAFSADWWVYYGFAQNYSSDTVLGGIGPAWTLGCEVVLYALLPLLSLVFARVGGLVGRGVWWQLEVAGLATLVVGSALYLRYGFANPSFAVSALTDTFGWFALGMALALASVVGSRGSGRGVALIATYSWAGWLVAAAAYLAICRGLGLDTGPVFFQEVSDAQRLAVSALSGVVAVGLVLPAVFEPHERGVMGRLLGSRPLAALGLVSYGVYLYHEPVARALNGGVGNGGDPSPRFLWLALATAGIAIMAGAASYYLIERPALRLKPRR